MWSTTIALLATPRDVLTQPALSPAQWRAEVEKMRTAYKAPIDAKDIDTIVNYLVALRPAR
jgi:hypothetical protein